MIHGGADPVKLRRLKKKKQKINSGFDALIQSVGKNGVGSVANPMGTPLDEEDIQIH